MRRLAPPACHLLSYAYSHVATIFLLSVSSSSFFLQVCVCYAVYHGTYGTDRSGCHHPMQVPDVLSVPGYDVLLLLFLPSYPLVLIVYLPLLLSLFGLCSPGIHYDPLSGYLFFFFPLLRVVKMFCFFIRHYSYSLRIPVLPDNVLLHSVSSNTDILYSCTPPYILHKKRWLQSSDCCHLPGEYLYPSSYFHLFVSLSGHYHSIIYLTVIH